MNPFLSETQVAEQIAMPLGEEWICCGDSGERRARRRVPRPNLAGQLTPQFVRAPLARRCFADR